MLFKHKYIWPKIRLILQSTVQGRRDRQTNDLVPPSKKAGPEEEVDEETERPQLPTRRERSKWVIPEYQKRRYEEVWRIKGGREGGRRGGIKALQSLL